MKGIETLKEVIIWHTDLIEEIYDLVEKKKGKKVTGWVAFKFLDNLFQLFPILTKHKEIAAEWQDLDFDEKAEIQQLVKTQLKIEHQYTEELAERLFYIIIELGDFLQFVLEKKPA
nr:hypothetical protein [Nanoarchaeota archaeon]